MKTTTLALPEPTKTYPDFFFGATTRPLMIGLRDDFTYFGLSFNDCCGLHFEKTGEAEFSGMGLKTPEQLKRLAEWLKEISLTPPSLKPREAQPIGWCQPGFSPEFEDESHRDDKDELEYDATMLNIYGVWSCYPDSSLHFHVAATEPDGADMQGVPLDAMRTFAAALMHLAMTWEAGCLDLTKEQPLG